MLKSMTAYGRSFFENSIGYCSLEMNCLNRRHLEVQLILPKEFMRFEPSVRKTISDYLSRGYITIKVNFRFKENTPYSIKPNIPLCKQQFEGWKSIASMLNREEKEVTLSLLQKENLFILEEDEKAFSLVEELIKKTLKEALEAMQEMMHKEGLTILSDVHQRSLTLSNKIEEIEIYAPKAVDKMKEKLVGKLKELFPLFSDNEEKVLREAFLLAERVDIAEEITRIKSHIIQFNETLHDPIHSQGKKLEFIIQETQREINTIASKSQDITISRSVIEFKTELERIREQLQNVE